MIVGGVFAAADSVNWTWQDAGVPAPVGVNVTGANDWATIIETVSIDHRDTETQRFFTEGLSGFQTHPYGTFFSVILPLCLCVSVVN